MCASLMHLVARGELQQSDVAMGGFSARTSAVIVLLAFNRYPRNDIVVNTRRILPLAPPCPSGRTTEQRRMTESGS